jgi:NADH dehydrogenase/NADH:ubiquinone oxidoreductase subunit G
MTTIDIKVDDRTLSVPAGTNLLTACLDNGINIPNLCHQAEGGHPPAACRLCFVEIEGRPAPTTACTVAITEPIAVRTDTEAVRALQRSALNLLLSVHKVECKVCPANRQCALQDIAKFLKAPLKPKGLPLRLKAIETVTTHPEFDYWPNRCVLCGRCVAACRAANGLPILSFAGRGFDTIIHVDPGSHSQQCRDCRVCLDACPVGALTPKNPEAEKDSAA